MLNPSPQPRPDAGKPCRVGHQVSVVEAVESEHMRYGESTKREAVRLVGVQHVWLKVHDVAYQPLSAWSHQDIQHLGPA